MGSSERMICGQVPPQVNQWVSSNPHHLKVEEGGSLTNHNEMSTQSPKIIKAYRHIIKTKKSELLFTMLEMINNLFCNMNKKRFKCMFMNCILPIKAHT